MELLMEFKRKRLRGQNQKVRKTWVSDDGYRIVWRREIHGIAVPARFQATVRTIIPNYGGTTDASFQMWDFTDYVHRLFKTRKTAEDSCKRHQQLWTKATEATGVRSLVDLFGKVPTGYPIWVRKKLNRKVYEVLNRPQLGKRREVDECLNPPDQPDPSVTLTTDTTGLAGQTPGPVLPVTVEDGTTTRKTRRTRAKATATSDDSLAESVKAPAKGRKRRAAKSTTKRSTLTSKRKRNTKASSKPAKSRSSGSRKQKSES